ncbi:hypothetical protein HPB51_022515 [Rhipicephalus microplus]|uniref:Uncharacterized protein n=1 Tax=Rhipicephalus microplus TaxID=6941 RepID=A0A9J6ECF8_RHIMP|nr:hypothetical protein HPB51_022515 [Rhipicephalus microplus]
MDDGSEHFPSEESRVGDSVEHPANEGPSNVTRGAGTSAVAPAAAASDGAHIRLPAFRRVSGASESTSSEESGEPALRPHPASRTGDQHQSRQIEFETTAPCNCTANTHSNDRRCAHVNVYQTRIPAINVNQQWNISSHDPNKLFGDAAELPTRADAFRRLREDRLKASARATIAPPAFPHSLRPGSTQRRPALWPHRLRTDLPDALDEAVGSPPSTLLPDTIDDLD